MRSKLFISGFVIFAIVVLLIVAAPLIATHDPEFIPEGNARLGMSSEHWFGTDQQGRDMFARTVYGGRISLTVGIVSALMATVIALAVGALAAIRGRWLDNLLMRTADVFFVFPAIVLAASFVLALGRNMWAVIFAIALTAWPPMARVVRSVVIEVNQSLYVEAARGAGLAERTVFRLHVLPRVLSVVLTLSVAAIATGVLTESALSFLSIGISEPTPSWGLMIAGGKRFLATDPHIVLMPAAAMVLTIGSLVMMHEALQRHASLTESERVDV